jgi:eukaryotic-like serine/threonine-protein kinase
MVYAGSGNDVYALTGDGKLTWKNSSLGPVLHSGPVTANGYVYVGGGDYVYSLNAASGHVNSRYRTHDLVESTPVINGDIYVGSNDGSVYALRGGSLAPAPKP